VSIGDALPLKFGVTIPFNDHQVGYEDIVALAEHVESNGFDSIWMADHLTGPTPMGAGRWYELVTLLASLAPRLPTLDLGTDIIVAGYRHPVLAAKMLATLDIVSRGRLIVAAATGYIEKEFDELGVPFHARGRYGEECIRVWKEMWSDGPCTFTGEFFDLTGVQAEPKPVQRPHPPLWLGGSSPAVLRRAIDIADGWHPIALPLAYYQSGVETLARLADELDRRDPFTLSYSGNFGLVTSSASDDENRPLLSGSPEQVRQDVADLRSLGVSNIVFRPGLTSVSNQEVLDQVSLVSTTVLPMVRDL